MMPIDALLSLPEQGGATAVSRESAAAFSKLSLKMVRRDADRWSLTNAGLRFLAQFRRRPPMVVEHLVVRLVVDNGTPLFHLYCDEDVVLRIHKMDLQRSLQKIRAANPSVRIDFDFRSQGRVS